MTAWRASSARGLIIVFALTMTLASVYASAQVPALATDGWHSWQVEAVANAPRWCCPTAAGAMTTASAGRCDLDARDGVDSSSSPAPASGRLNVYLRVEQGKTVAVRALDATCPVAADGGIDDHGALDTDSSARWLASRVRAVDGPLRGALPALAMHAGEVSTRALRQFAASGPGLRLRKDAVFWMGQSRARMMRADLRRYLFDDPDPDMREHAAFCWSQTQLEGRGDALIELAGRDASPRVRGQAWFWLGQTGDPRTEAAIAKALRSEGSAKVREQAVFALSQLGDGRGAAALIAVVEDRALTQRDRERAVFWLAQDDSEQALAYLVNVLD